MKILILHRVPFAVLRYDELIDHSVHEVVYLGPAERLSDVPAHLRATRIELGEGLDHAAHVERHPGEFAGVDRVVSASQYTLRAAARIRELVGCPGMRTAAFDQVDDKVAMKARIRACGLRAPEFMPYPEFLARSEWPWSAKTVLKPRAETSSRNVAVFASPQELLEQAAQAPDSVPVAGAGAAAVPSAENMQVEEFVEGQIYHFDGIASGGEVLLLQPSRYFGTCLDYARGAPLGSLQFDDAQMQAVATEYVRAAGIEDGAFHLEMIGDRDGLCFLEIAPRVGGGGINDVIRLRWGIDLTATDIAMQAGMPAPAALTQVRPESFGFYLLPGHLHAGRTCRVRTDYRYPECIVAESPIDPATPLGADISANEGEVPLYLIVKHDHTLSGDELMASLGRSIDLQYSCSRE